MMIIKDFIIYVGADFGRTAQLKLIKTRFETPRTNWDRYKDTPAAVRCRIN